MVYQENSRKTSQTAISSSDILAFCSKGKGAEFLHVDYNSETWSKDPDKQLVSAIITIKAFSLDIDASKNNMELTPIPVHPGKMIISR